MSSKKISDEELREEAENGATLKQIKNKYGYAASSYRLKQRLKDLGFRKLRKISFYPDHGGCNVAIQEDDLDEAEAVKDFSFDGSVYYQVSVTDSGDFLVSPREKQLVKDGDE